MFFLTQEGVDRAYLKGFPADLWCTNSLKGIRVVAPYRAFLKALKEALHYVQIGENRAFFDLPNFWSEYMCFSDRTEAYNLDDLTYGRMAPAVVGTMYEYERFCKNFVVVPAPLYVPPVKELVHWYEFRTKARGLGSIIDSDDFGRVIEYAHEIVAESRRVIG